MRTNRKNLFVIMLILVVMISTLLIGCSEKEPAADTEQQTTTATQEVETTAAEETESTETTEATEETNATEAAKATAATKAKSSSGKSSDSKETNKTTGKQPTKSNINATKATEVKKVCFITVDGYCSSKQIEIKGGESVYDILKKTGVSISARNTGYGLYIEGINGRFEFDEGPTSGWVYTVNGFRPNTSCSNYKVKSGDKIVWTYVDEV